VFQLQNYINSNKYDALNTEELNDE